MESGGENDNNTQYYFRSDLIVTKIYLCDSSDSCDIGDSSDSSDSSDNSDRKTVIPKKLFSCPEHILKSSFLSIRPLVGPSVSPSVRQSVHLCEKVALT